MHKIKLLLTASTLLFSCLLFANESITITEAWISEAPPTVSVLAAYAKIQNASTEAQTLISVTSPNFSKVELHLSKVVNEMAIMEKQDSLQISANGSVELSPGNYHLMLFNPKAPLKAGDTATITFNFVDGTSSTIEARVEKRKSSGHEHHNH
jgi:copper(I)-binding protein